MFTPDGSDKFVRASTTFALGSMMSITRLCIRISNCSRASLWTNDERLTVAREHNRNFIDCVKSRQEPMAPVEMAIRCDTICHMSIAAAKTGRTIQWDPKKEQFLDDPEANRLVDRDIRSPWSL